MIVEIWWFRSHLCKIFVLTLGKVYLVNFHQLIRRLHLFHFQSQIILLEVDVMEIHGSIIDLLTFHCRFLWFSSLFFNFLQLLLLFFSQLLGDLWTRTALGNVYLSIFVLFLGVLILLLSLNDHYFFSSLVFQTFRLMNFGTQGIIGNESLAMTTLKIVRGFLFQV